MRSLFLKRLPADIQQILLVSDAPLEQLALQADAMLVARAPTSSIATVSVATTTSAVTLGALAAHVATLSEAVQKISTQERSHSRPRFRTPSPPRFERDIRRSATPNRHPRFRVPSLPRKEWRIAHQHLRRAFEDPLAGRRARPTIPMDLPRHQRPTPHHRRRFLGALRSDG